MHWKDRLLGRTGCTAFVLAAVILVIVVAYLKGHLTWPSAGSGETQELEEAIAAFERAIELQPGNVEAWIYLGKALASGGEPDKAVDLYERGLAHVGSESEKLNAALGQLLFEHGDYERAADTLNRAIAADSENAGAWTTLGMVFTRLGRQEEAIFSYRRVLELNPDHYWASHLLARLLVRRKQWAEAASLAQRAAKTAPDDKSQARSLAILAQANVGLNDTETACENLLDAYAILQSEDILQDARKLCGVVRTSLDR